MNSIGWQGSQPMDTTDLHLEALRVDHAEEMASLLDDPRLHTYVGGQPETLEQLRERYRRQVAGCSVDGSRLWFNWVLRHQPTGRAIGLVQVSVSTQEKATVAEIAWIVGSDYQGRGYACQAAETVVSWLDEIGVESVIAYVHPDHRASMAVATSIGMRPTTTVKDGELRWAR